MKSKELIVTEILENSVFKDQNVDIFFKTSEVEISISKSRYDKSYKSVIDTLQKSLTKIDQTASISGQNKTKKVISLSYNLKKASKILKQNIDIKFKLKNPPNITAEMGENGSIWIFNQALSRNESFSSIDEVKEDQNYGELKKIFKNQDVPTEWFDSYLKQNKKITEKFADKQWEKIEYKSNSTTPFQQFITKCLKKVDSSKKYESWNPSDIWIIRKDKKNFIERILTKTTSGKTKTQTIYELNDLLNSLIKKQYLIGISLKKVGVNSPTAKFVYINVKNWALDQDDIDEEYNVKDIDITFKLFENNRKDYVEQCFIKLGDNSLQIKSNQGASYAISNLKFESLIKGGGGRGGKAPVELVGNLFNSANKFDNKYQNYTFDKFTEDKEKYKKMYDKVKSHQNVKTDSTISSGSDFVTEIENMFQANDKKTNNLAIIKLMELSFLHSALEQQDQEEFWTDLLYLSLKKNRKLSDSFAPHGKLY